MKVTAEEARDLIENGWPADLSKWRAGEETSRARVIVRDEVASRGGAVINITIAKGKPRTLHVRSTG